ncbi:phosphotransferase family protein [Nocardioides immobilis]|uniref:Phosphotransferase family protein n=1 Tax=Nocardioides immobilis TaxID=2049295 RepID=A0A417Y4K6_9ACTN|nr:phosphotransferase family protein [Nocardioides immobilis]RHW27618.1 phosphotransferase family protein [Nocardioides immobilis]
MSGPGVAGAQEVREEDAFDVPAVEAWLQDRVDGVPGRIVEVQQFSGGASNLTYLLRLDSGRDLILRRPPAGTKAKGAHDMGREHRIQAALAPVFPYVATMVGYCDNPSVIGSEFYVMDRVPGHIPRRELGIDLPTERVRELCTNVLDLLVALHSVDPAGAGLASLGKGEGYVARQVGGWSARFRKSKTWNVPSWKRTMAWLDENQPADRRTCLIHNDFRFDNVVLDADDPTKPVALLDWEMATLGDPLMDLGAVMSYWVQADDDRMYQVFRMQPTDLPGMLTRTEAVDYYCARTGIELTGKEWAFYEAFGLFRLAVILQQIYYRYHHKQTTNPRFKKFWLASWVLHRRARAIIRKAGG